MTKNKYFFVRFDDICPTMDWEQFGRAAELMDKYDIKPLIGVIPDNRDEEQMKDSARSDFWELIKSLQDNGWGIAMHGYNHVYNQSNPKTVICGRKHSEFAGNDYFKQCEMIKNGKAILEGNGIFTDMFFAPAHSYDKNTLKALAANGFRYNIDGLSQKPYVQCGIINIPCRAFGVPGRCKNKINVAVNHSSEWTRPDKAHGYDDLSAFCEKYKEWISDFSKVKEIAVGNYIAQKATEKLYCAELKMKHVISKIIG